MTRLDTLKALEKSLESFLEKAVKAKGERLAVITGLSRLDDLARQAEDSLDFEEELGSWLASHHGWLADTNLKASTNNQSSVRPGDFRRLLKMLSVIEGKLIDSKGAEAQESAEQAKLKSEIGRWLEHCQKFGGKIILHRGPESVSEDQPEADTLSKFSAQLERLGQIWENVSSRNEHVLSALTEALDMAQLQKNRDGLILSALMIYYLKQERYKVEPFISRLRIVEKEFLSEFDDA